MSWEAEMVERLKKAVNGEKDRIIAEYHRLTGKSPQTLYRIAKRCGYMCGRKCRKDKGDLKSGLTDAQVEYIAGLVHTTSRDNKGGIMPVERAIEITEDTGIIEPCQISTSAMQRILRDREISKAHLRQPTPHVEMRSLHPNHVHLVDVSVCIQYYLAGGKMRIMGEKEFYKNKVEKLAKIKTRLLRYLLVDHFSGAFHLKYFDTTGETAANLFEFLCEGWGVKPDPRLPFRGVPFYMLQDAGSANIGKPMRNFFERLGVQMPDNMPHNPRRQGAVESIHNVIEQWFESSLRIQPAHTPVQLNEWALDFSIKFQAMKRHTRHGMTRTACWLQIRPEQLRELPPEDILRDLFACPQEKRTVDGNRSVSFRSKTYRLRHVEGIRPGSEVMVTLRPYHWPQVGILFNDVEYLVDPVDVLPRELGGFKADALVIGQEYRAQPETKTQQAVKRMENMAYGEDRKRGSVPFAGAVVYGHQADKVGNVCAIPKRGTPIELGRDVVARDISIMELFARLRAEVGQISPELNRELREEFGQSIEVKTAEAVIAAIAAGEEWKGQRPEDRDQRSVRA